MKSVILKLFIGRLFCGWVCTDRHEACWSRLPWW